MRTRRVLHNAKQMTRGKLKNSGDVFLVRCPRGKSGLGDLSGKHDEYLYGRKRIHGSS